MGALNTLLFAIESRAKNCNVGKYFVLSLFCALVASCTQHAYKLDPPRGEKWEFLKDARTDIHPHQVIESPVLLAEHYIAWAGIILDAKPIVTKYGAGASILVDHHYFDWKEYHGPHRETLFLSPRGEGQFTVVYLHKPEMTAYDIQQKFKTGMMIAAFGHAVTEKLDDVSTSPQLHSNAVYTVSEPLYRMDVYDYGREGEPVKKIARSPYWKIFDSVEQVDDGGTHPFRH